MEVPRDCLFKLQLLLLVISLKKIILRYYFSVAEEEGSDDEPVTSSAAVDRVDSPNLLTIGLSKETLNKLGFRFKEDIVVESKIKLG